jgi:excisionase family DNA binding protein
MAGTPTVVPDAEWLTVDEFAALLRMPRSSVYEAVSRGRLEHRRVGKSIRIHRDAGFVPVAPARPRKRAPRVVIVRNQRRSA